MPASAYSTRLQLPLPAGGDFDTRLNHNELVTQAEIYIADKPTVDAHVTATAPHSGHALLAGSNTFSATQTASESTATVTAWGARVNGDSALRWTLGADGKTSWGNGSSGPDTYLYRSAGGTLRTDGALSVGNGIAISAGGLTVLGDTASFKAVSSTQTTLFVRPADDLNSSTLLLSLTNAAGSAVRFSVDKTGAVVQSGGHVISGGGLNVQGGGLTVVGNSNITGTLVGLTGLTIATGTVNFTGATLIGFGGSGGNFASPTITGTVTGGAAYPGISLNNPAITGAVTGGASYNSVTLNNPTITGTVAGGATYSGITLTAPVVTGGIGITGNATVSGTISGPTVSTTTLNSGTLGVAGLSTLTGGINMGSNVQVANSSGYIVILANGSLYLRAGTGASVNVDNNALNVVGALNVSGNAVFSAGLTTTGSTLSYFGSQVVLAQANAVQWTDSASQVMSSSRTTYFDEFSGGWRWRDSSVGLYWAMSLSRLGALGVAINTQTPLGMLHVGGSVAGTTAWSQVGNAGPNSPNTIGNPNGVLMVSDQLGNAAGAGGTILIGAGAGLYFAAMKGFLTNGSNNGTGDLAVAMRRTTTDITLTEVLVFKASGDIYVLPAGLGMTYGFLWISAANGGPGTPAVVPAGRAAIYYDSSTNQLCVWNSGWKRTGVMS